MNQPGLKTALVGYRLNSRFSPLLTGVDILSLKPEKRTPKYLARMITARIAHAYACQALDNPHVWGAAYTEEEQYGLRLSDDLLLKTRWKPSLILLRSKPLHPETITPVLRLDSLLEKHGRKYVVKTAIEPMSEERSFDIGTGMIHLRKLLDGSHSLLMYATPDAGKVNHVGPEMKRQRIGCELFTIPHTNAEIESAAANAYDTYRSGTIRIDPKDLTELRLVS